MTIFHPAGTLENGVLPAPPLKRRNL